MAADNVPEADIIRLVNLLEKSAEVFDKQKKLIDDLIKLNKTYVEIVNLKDQTIDRQLQMLQLMELKLKEFGFDLGDPLSL